MTSVILKVYTRVLTSLNMKNKTGIRELQEEHKRLNRLTTDLEKDRQSDRSTVSKYNLMRLKKTKLAIKDNINFIRYTSRASTEKGNKTVKRASIKFRLLDENYWKKWGSVPSIKYQKKIKKLLDGE